MLYFPTPYPDELIGSLLIRACRHLGISQKVLNRQVGLSTSTTKFFTASHLPKLAKLTNVSPQELLLNNTVFTYATAFMPTEHRNKLLNRLVTDDRFSEQRTSNSFIQCVTQGVRFRRLCPACIQEDLLTFGESYWHRSHNLPATYICPKHCERLRGSNIGLRLAILRGSYDLPDEVSWHDNLPQLRFEVAQNIAIANERLLAGNPKGNINWFEHYREIAKFNGFIKAGNYIASKPVTMALHQFYGTALLEETGLPLSTQSQGAWPGLMLRTKNPIEVSTLKHVLLEVFLGAVNELPSKVLYKNPGKKPRDYKARDQELATAIDKILSATPIGTKRFTVPGILSDVGGWAEYRHDRKLYPETTKVIAKLRHSSQSIRPLKEPPR